MDFSKLVTPGVRDLQPYLPGKPSEEVERELGLSNVVKLASNESPLGPGPRAREALARAAQDVSRYPDANGYYLKQRLSALHRISVDHFTLGNGSNDVLDIIARCFVLACHEVVLSEHSFVVFGLAANSQSAKPVITPATAWGHDLNAMAAAVTERTRLIYIANPNNPTGTWNTASELDGFLATVPEHVMVVVDQAYAEYITRADYADCIPWLGRYPNLIVTRTFSKVHGLAAIRVGYAVSHPDVADYMNRVRHPFNVNSLGLAAAQAALDDREHIERSIALNNAGMHYLTESLDALGLGYIPSIGNFVTVDIGQPAGPVFHKLLLEGVIVRPLANYGMPNHLRISVGLEQENRRCMAAVAKVVGGG